MMLIRLLAVLVLLTMSASFPLFNNSLSRNVPSTTPTVIHHRHKAPKTLRDHTTNVISSNTTDTSTDDAVWLPKKRQKFDETSTFCLLNPTGHGLDLSPNPLTLLER
ncbi:hypothetical protein COOONC_02301 [Cooperia oncophora]